MAIEEGDYFSYMVRSVYRRYVHHRIGILSLSPILCIYTCIFQCACVCLYICVRMFNKRFKDIVLAAKEDVAAAI